MRKLFSTFDITKQVTNNNHYSMITASEILNDIAYVYGTSVEQLKVRNRSDEYSFCRKVFVYVCANKTKMPKSAISRKINRDSSYCRKALETIQQNIANDDPKWSVFWGKYQRESKIWNTLQ